jgi:hypothetical protein
MTSLSKLKITNKNIYNCFAIAVFIFAGVVNPSIATPSNWSYKIGNNLRFDFKGCSKSNNDLICTANFRSQNGEQKINIGPGWDSNKYVAITNSGGIVYMADEVKIGNNWVCRSGTTCGNFSFLPGVGEFTFVEGVNYETVFTFRDISLPTLKMPLFVFSTDGVFSSSPVRIRNINVTDPTLINVPQKPRTNTASQPNGLAYKLSDALRFNFKGCSKSIDTNDVVCTGNFRSSNGEQRISVGSGSSITITDSKGAVYNADEIKIGDAFSCRNTRCEIDLVEGVDYKTSFIFKDISLNYPQISLFYFQSTSEFVGTRFQIKARNINLTTARFR